MRLLWRPMMLAVAVAFGSGCGASGETPPALAPATPRPSDALSAAEHAALHRGEEVVRPNAFQRHGQRYVGGVAYQIVDAPSYAVLSAVRDPARLSEMLPRVIDILEVPGDGPRRLAVRQGNALVQAAYTVAFEEPPGGGELRFRLDASQPHDVQDFYGYFRARDLGNGKSLVTVGVALDLGPGLVRMLFERRIQELMLTTPGRMRDVIERYHGPTLVARADTH